MDWDKCAKMVELSNNKDENFYKFVLDNLKDINGQSLEMLMDSVELTKSNISKRLEFFNQIINHIKGIEGSENNYGTAMRIKVMTDIVKLVC